ncbi:UvrB/UvrC motif-containing protein [Oscillibacter sp.]|uniref:UvrB/UvrC motif-containing protein n=1 Tax=Oscillibacter sp. TaxID=1945593 RepID=UPI0026379616|nr:UvrB/UvrC motif-containing protein [Oscillibacter sp.]MDD3346649.1 UvrB/UvrC motif-containing protein [Oscillibacter sp.]
MKCENCGKNEVTFLYQSNINGKVTEKHLCSECAEKLGLTQRVAAQSRRMMENFFGDRFFGGGFLENFFSPQPLLSARKGWLLEDPFDDFFADMPALGAEKEAEQAEQTDSADLVDAQEQSRFSYLRELNALRLEMKKAVHTENFEQAAKLRDEIHQLEAQHKEKKERA